METKSLGRQTSHVYVGADAALLDRVPNPMHALLSDAVDEIVVQIEATEFTSICPVTGGPDFATIVIGYTPREWLVESKSLKLYLGSFRNEPVFHEKVVATIARDLVELLDPDDLSVEGKFNPRGGITIHPYVSWSK